MVNERHAENEPLLSTMERQQANEPENRANPTEHPDAPLEDTTRRELEVDDDSSPSTPRFMQEEGPWKRWKWVPYPVRRIVKATVKWSMGPPNPQDYKIKPILPQVQEFPLVLVEKYLPSAKHRVGVVFLYIAIWIITFALVKRSETFATEIEGWGAPQPIGCGATYWGRGNKCGLNGADCRPFDGSGFPFRCPANCKGYMVLNPRAVGDQEIVYQSLVIGGPANDTSSPIYRGDSFLCSAAIHAGVVSNENGGCGVVRLVGRQQNYISSDRNDIESISFDSYFPLSFTFEPNIQCRARDLRWNLLAVSVVFTTVLSLFTASPALFFFSVFTGIFWHVGLASDPPNHWSVADLVSNIAGKFLPAMFCAWVMYDKMGIRRTLHGLTAQVEKTILWLGGCWVGALTNYTFRWIPIQRLNAHDLQQQPGAKAALAIIIIVLFLIIVKQVWYFRQEGRLVKYLKLYLLFVGAIIVCLILPDLSLRIHHYILALLLLPGTSMQTRPSLLYQGILVGLFINGIARWGFDAVLQTPAALQGDAQHGSPLPTILPPVIDLAQAMWSVNFTWNVPSGVRYDGISVLVNDVERFRTYFDDGPVSSNHFVWTRNSSLGLNEYFRFGYMEGSQSYDFTKAGIWNAEGSWIDMKPGPSMVRSRSLEEDEESVPR
ncbi:lccl domain containing protein [Colletotrichum truncatum]|uniref:Lccl domain containing protein n=1 Tax=Colletotrichum truncatum TaxID=5467 RepID=A0ACC3ZHU1_COLTU|nr:lccl domain containing protein [Colletotrichum truncatum]KAF6786733.1 lccl domain containing protein [Colletotrichum truncatum]